MAMTFEDLQSYDFSRCKIFISTPMYGGVCTALFHESMLELQRVFIDRGIRACVSGQRSDALITRARNNEADKFRAELDATHHLFIDADIGFRAMDILQLIAAEKDVIVGPYAKKHIKWDQVLMAAKAGWPAERLAVAGGDVVFNGLVELNGEPQKIRDGATGLMLIRRHVYDRMEEYYPQIRYKPLHDEKPAYGDHFCAFFDTEIDPETQHYMSEDYTFCRRWARMGGDVWMLPWLKTVHQGSYAYPCNIYALAEIKPSDVEEPPTEQPQAITSQDATVHLVGVELKSDQNI